MIISYIYNLVSDVIEGRCNLRMCVCVCNVYSATSNSAKRHFSYFWKLYAQFFPDGMHIKLEEVRLEPSFHHWRCFMVVANSLVIFILVMLFNNAIHQLFFRICSVQYSWNSCTWLIIHNLIWIWITTKPSDLLEWLRSNLILLVFLIWIYFVSKFFCICCKCISNVLHFQSLMKFTPFKISLWYQKSSCFTSSSVLMAFQNTHSLTNSKDIIEFNIAVNLPIKKWHELFCLIQVNLITLLLVVLRVMLLVTLHVFLPPLAKVMLPSLIMCTLIGCVKTNSFISLSSYCLMLKHA